MDNKIKEEVQGQLDNLTYRVVMHLLESESYKLFMDHEFATFDPMWSQNKDYRTALERKSELLAVIKTNFQEKFEPLVDKYYGRDSK